MRTRQVGPERTFWARSSRAKDMGLLHPTPTSSGLPEISKAARGGRVAQRPGQGLDYTW